MMIIPEKRTVGALRARKASARHRCALRRRHSPDEMWPRRWLNAERAGQKKKREKRKNHLRNSGDPRRNTGKKQRERDGKKKK